MGMSDENESSDDEAPEEVVTSKETNVKFDSGSKSKKSDKKKRGGKKKQKKEIDEVEVISEDVLLQAANENSSSKAKTKSQKELKKTLQNQAELNLSRHKRFSEIENSKPHKRSRDDNFELEVISAATAHSLVGVKPSEESVKFAQKLLRGGSQSRVSLSVCIYTY
jgi:hypothetical protein